MTQYSERDPTKKGSLRPRYMNIYIYTYYTVSSIYIVKYMYNYIYIFPFVACGIL